MTNRTTKQTDPDGGALGERILRQADAAVAKAFKSMSQASTDAQATGAPSGKGKDGRRKPKIKHHDWYASAGPRSDSRRMLTLIEFADWLCAVNPLFDRDLPKCWIRHTMDRDAHRRPVRRIRHGVPV